MLSTQKCSLNVKGGNCYLSDILVDIAVFIALDKDLFPYLSKLMTR